MSRPLRVGIVGAGGIVRLRHWPGLKATEGVTLSAVANGTEASARRFLDEVGVRAAVMPDWPSLVASPDIDIVWIGAHPDLHEPVTMLALASGKNVFCQARMARDLDEAQRMLMAAASRPDLVTMLCPPPFGLRNDAFMRRLLADQILGPIRHLHLRSLNASFLDADAPSHWRQRREVSGRNVMTLGIYTEVLQRWFGDIASLEAKGEITTPLRHGESISIPDRLTVRAQFATGADATLEFSNVDPNPPLESLVITGETGTLIADFAAETLTLESEGRTELLTTPPELDRPWQVERDFIDAVRNPSAPRPHPTFRDGTAYMRVVDAVETARLTASRQFLEVPS